MVLPDQLSLGHEVYFASTMVHRSYLPDGVLSDQFFPMLICPEKTKWNMILPLRFWSNELRRSWGNLCESMEQTSSHPVLMVEFPKVTPIQRNELIALTEKAANAIRRIIKDEGLPGSPVVVVQATAGGYAVQLARSCDQQNEISVESKGLTICIPKQQVSQLHGSLIDYRETDFGIGFIVDAPND